ncbi:MAG TPA: ATP-binding cassette domain-containing protein, partial [Bacteroidales bacterium]|nr:ATP-binding cassette domain-containing protein [Bacteroidales bacterium]
DRPDEGQIIYRGKPLNNFSPAESSEYRSLHTGFIFQDHLLMPYLTVIENILFPVYARKLSGGEMNEARQRALMMAERTGISGILEKYPFQISGGEAQRTALVRALINKPSILLADEPTGSLDPSNAEILGNLLKEISETEGTAVILATHSEKLAGRMAAIYRLVNGKLVRI